MIMVVVQHSLSAPNVTDRRSSNNMKNRQNIVDGYYVRRHRRFHQRRRRPTHTLARRHTNEHWPFFVIPLLCCSGCFSSEKRRHRIMMIIVVRRTCITLPNANWKTLCNRWACHWHHRQRCRMKGDFSFPEQRNVCVSAWSLLICSHVPCLSHGIRFSNKGMNEIAPTSLPVVSQTHRDEPAQIECQIEYKSFLSPHFPLSPCVFCEEHFNFLHNKSEWYWCGAWMCELWAVVLDEWMPQSLWWSIMHKYNSCVVLDSVPDKMRLASVFNGFPFDAISFHFAKWIFFHVFFR